MRMVVHEKSYVVALIRYLFDGPLRFSQARRKGEDILGCGIVLIVLNPNNTLKFCY